MKALIFGATGQDGSYLIEHLIESGHEVVATRRPVAFGGRITRPAQAPAPEVRWLSCDVRQPDAVATAVIDAQPDVVFNLAAVTTPGASWLDPAGADVAEANALGALNVLRMVERWAPGAKLVHASSSAIYDPARYGLYGASKVFAHEAVKGYRSRGVWASNAVLYSHTSPRQDGRFLVPYICEAAARIRAGSTGVATERIGLRDPASVRDWMHAQDAVRALLAIAELVDDPDDFDVASGDQWSALAVASLALDVAFGGAGGAQWSTADMVDAADGPGYQERRAQLDPIHETGWWAPRSWMPDIVTEMVRAASAELEAEAAAR